MATLNKYTSVLAAILSDISDDSDTSFIYTQSANERRQRNDDEMTLTAVSAAKHRTKSQFLYQQTRVMWLTLPAAKFPTDPKKWERSHGSKRLVKDRCRKSGERSKGTLKPHINGSLYSNTVIGTLANDGARPRPSSLYQM